jgi:hypothetical protein
MAEKRTEAALLSQRPVSRLAAATVIGIWIACAVLAAWLGYRYLRAR